MTPHDREGNVIHPDAVPFPATNIALDDQSIKEMTSRPWTWREHAIYDIGHRDGESCRQSDWSYALTEYCELPDTVDEEDPMAVAQHIAGLQ